MSNDYQAKPDSGSLFATQSKKTPKSPDYFGTIHINLKDLTNIKTEDGLTVIKISGWKKVAKNGKTFLSLAVDRFVPQQQGSTRQENQAQEFPADDSDIPF
jgi:hypothetical protein